MGEFSSAFLELYGRAAAEQGGVISGDNPAHWNPSNPIRLWIIQLVIIISTTQLLSLGLSRIRQPRVIAEVIGGVILGPTVMGRIPNFKKTIFPDESMPLLTITSTVGLILFLFLVGLEIDTRVLKKNVWPAATVSVAGLLIPLGMGAALGVGVYREFIDPSVNYGYFLLFVAVAIGITAFPVLCRILTELKLLETDVGLIVLSAGIGNDVIGWVLLALTVALVNSSGGLTALWVLLASAAYTVFLLYPGRWAFRWLAKRTGSLEQGSPTPFMMTVTLLTVFVSAFFTDIIGVHAIFGGFIVGLIIPHDNGFAISIVEKVEDLVTILFLPIYFTLSGLKTNLGLLNDGITWGYIVIICLVAFASKFFACAGAALAYGFNWRESGAIGSLMSCKGLVELIVLNIGLQAKILDGRTFSMFVVHALVLTFITTPLTLLFYSPKHRKGRLEKKPAGDEASTAPVNDGDDNKSRLALVLDKVEQIPAAMTFSQLFANHASPSTNRSKSDEKADDPTPIDVKVLRLMELTNRTSAVLRSQESESLIHNDPVVNIYRTFGKLNSIGVSASLSVVNHDEFADAVAAHASETASQMVVIPWPRGVTSVSEGENVTRNPFDGAFHKTTTEDQTTSVVYSEYIRNVFAKSPVDVALFVERGSSSHSSNNSFHLFLPFFGGPDDRAALSLLDQLCENPAVSATVVKIVKTDSIDGGDAAVVTSPAAQTSIAALDTVYPAHSTQTRLASDTADNILWDQVSRNPASSRVVFNTVHRAKPLHHVIELVRQVASESSDKTLIVFTGRSRRMAAENHQVELRDVLAEHTALTASVPRTLGDVAAALVSANVNASLTIVQAGHGSSA